MRKFLITTLLLLSTNLAFGAEQAKRVATDTTNFNGSLSASNTTVQSALDALDDVVGGGSGDITDVWTTASGNVNALTAASGDSFNAASADSSIPATQSTTQPATCTEGQLHQDTNDGGTELFVCTATNTWTKVIAATDNVATATALASNPSDCSANQFANTIAASGNLSCSAIADADVPDTITISLAATATALAANGANCSAGSYPLGVDASGAAESCGTTITGNAGTATALAANGSNCSAGNYPLGVDASGAVETCTADDDVPDAGEVDDTALAAGAVDGGNGGEIADGSVTADDLGADSVSSSELNATGVEAELEAVMDLQDMQGAVTDSQVPDTITITNLSGTNTGDVTLSGTPDYITILGQVITRGTIDIGDDTNLTAGDHITLTGDDLDVDDDFLLLTGDTTTGSYDFGGGSVEIPNSNTLPVTCIVGQIYMDTDATSGQRIYACQSTDTWALQGDGGGGGSGDVTDVGNCSGGACFTGSTGTTLTSTTSEILDLATANTLIYQRNDAGSVTFMGKDNSDPADTIYDTSGAGAITVGSADVTSVTVTTDSTGTAEFVLPAGAIDSTEILDNTVADGDVNLTHSIPLTVQSAKLTGAFVTATVSGADTAAESASINAGDGGWNLLMDASTDEAFIWQFKLPAEWTAHGTFYLNYSMASATTNEVEFEVAVMCSSSGDSADIGTASFAAAVTVSETVPGTAGYPKELSFTLTDDSCAARDDIFIYVSTDANDGTNDDATGDREVISGLYTFNQ